MNGELLSVSYKRVAVPLVALFPSRGADSKAGAGGSKITPATAEAWRGINFRYQANRDCWPRRRSRRRGMLFTFGLMPSFRVGAGSSLQAQEGHGRSGVGFPPPTAVRCLQNSGRARICRVSCGPSQERPIAFAIGANQRNSSR